jgi:hypothetical protein
MAHRGNNPRNPHLQVGSRVTSLFLFLTLSFASPTAQAAISKPTPKPTATVTAKASTKPTFKATAKPTVKTTAKPTSTATVRSSAKPTVSKKPIVKKKKRAKVRVSPSPKASWPPKGFSVEGEVYAKVPTAQELVGLISANSYLSKQIKQCTSYICGAVQVASETGCLWWEVIATVSDAQGDKLGELNSSFNSSGERELKVLLLISPETVEKGGAAKITSVICHHEDRDNSLPGTSYKKS